MVKKLAIIREIFKGDHNAAARKLTQNQISALSGTLNYHQTLQNIKRDIRKWSSRFLSPFGRITVVMTNILSKYIHLFSSLSRSDNFQNQLNQILFKFVWDGKPGKIKRITICHDYLDAGLKMINIKKFEQALKVNWVRKFLSSSDSQWYRLFKKSYGNPDKILSFWEDIINIFLKNMTNPFWHNVINNWIDIHEYIIKFLQGQIMKIFKPVFGTTLRSLKAQHFSKIGLNKESIQLEISVIQMVDS